MNIDYLKNVIIPNRKTDILNRKNARVHQPIYVVYSLQEIVGSGHIDMPLYHCNYMGKDCEYGYIDDEADEKEFNTSGKGMISPVEVTRFWIDRAAAFFLTRDAADKYLQYQKHNLGDAYVYVHHSGYRNHEMDMLLNNS